MKGRIEEIQAKCPGVQGKYIVCDFGKLTKMSEYRDAFSPVIEGLDIAVGIANAGSFTPVKFEDTTDSSLEMTVNINTLQAYYVMKILSESMLKRDKRSALIVTSSLAAIRPVPLSVAYCASKVFADYLAKGMALEMGHKIDVMSFAPS